MKTRHAALFLCTLLCTSCIQFPQNPKGPARCGNVPLPPPNLISWWPLESFTADPNLMNTADTPDVVSGLTAHNGINDVGSSTGIAPPFQILGHSGYGAHYQFHGRIGDVGYAYFFDPQGKTNFGSTGDFTIDAWVKPGCSSGPPNGRTPNERAGVTIIPPPPPCAPYPAVIVKKLSLTAGYSFYIDANRHLVLDMKGPGGSAHFVTQATFSGSGWSFVSVRVPRVPSNTNLVQFWMNGTLPPLDTVAGDPPTKDTSTFDIANGEAGTFGGGDIMLDEVEIFGRALQFWETLDIVTRGKCLLPSIDHSQDQDTQTGRKKPN